MLKKKKNAQEENDFMQYSVPAYGYDLLRDTFLKDLLGKDYGIILYWGGKNLARKFPLHSIDQVIDFFEKAGFGKLVLKMEDKNKIVFELSSELISYRLEQEIDYSYQLEAGFLAEQIQHIKKVEAEAIEQSKKRNKAIVMTVKWD